MKFKIASLLFGFIFTFGLCAQEYSKSDTVKVIKDFKVLYQYHDFFLAGQPSIEALKWLKDEGVTKIINLRSESENEDFTGYAYNEKDMAEELGFEYYSVPVKGKAGYTPGNLAKMDSLIHKDDIVLIHCAGAGRVKHFFMAYLVKSKGYTVNEAIHVGKQMDFYLPIELLLDEKLSITIKD